MNETVTIVTPTLNQAEFLPEALQSVAGQDYADVEHLVFDGGSTDATVDILRRHQQSLAHWESGPDGGQAAAINKGWERASGSVLSWLNSDDTLLPGAVSSAMRFLRAHPDVGIVYGDTRFTDDLGNAVSLGDRGREFDYDRLVLECDNPIPQPSTFIRRSVLEAVGLLDPTLHYVMDWDLWLRAGLAHRIVHVPEIWSTYRIHYGSKTGSAEYLRTVPDELERMYRRYFERHAPEHLRQRRQYAMASMYCRGAAYAIASGWNAGGVRCGFRALAARPSLATRLSGVRQLLYCFAGGTKPYGAVRRWLRESGDRA